MRLQHVGQMFGGNRCAGGEIIFDDLRKDFLRLERQFAEIAACVHLPIYPQAACFGKGGGLHKSHTMCCPSLIAIEGSPNR